MTPERLAELHELANAAMLNRANLASELAECLGEIERLRAACERLSKSSVLLKWANGYYRNKGVDE